MLNHLRDSLKITTGLHLIRAAAAVAALVLCTHVASSADRDAKDMADWREKYAEYRRLPAEVRQRMQELDENLRAMDAETRERLLHLIRRYNEWLERLPPQERQFIDEAANSEEKIKRVREMRERQWIASLPKADRDRIAAAATAEEKQKLIAEVRKRQEERDLAWHLVQERQEEREAASRWYREEMNSWIQKELMPKLTPQEKQELQRTRSFSQYRKVIDLAKKYGVPLPPALQKLPIRSSPWPMWWRSRTPTKRTAEAPGARPK